MVNSISSILTAMAMLPHALLGCCWHHVHECETPAAVSSADESLAADTCHAHHHHLADQHDHAHDAAPASDAQSTDEGDGSPHQDHPDPCDEPECAFVSLAKPHVELGAALAVWLATADSFAPVMLTGGSDSCAVTPPRDRPASPLRAQTQVWRL